MTKKAKNPKKATHPLYHFCGITLKHIHARVHTHTKWGNAVGCTVHIYLSFFVFDSFSTERERGRNNIFIQKHLTLN